MIKKHNMTTTYPIKTVQTDSKQATLSPNFHSKESFQSLSNSNGNQESILNFAKHQNGHQSGFQIIT